MAPFITLLLAPSKSKLDECIVQNQCLNFLENVILVNFEANWSKCQFLKKILGLILE